MKLALLGALLFPPLLSLARSIQDEFIAKAKANKGIVTLDSDSFYQLTAPDRTWSATIQLTALGSSIKCPPCRAFDPAFVDVAKAWTKAPAESRNQHFFATLDFDKGADIFRKMELASAPVVFTYLPTKGPRRPANGKTDKIPYDFSTGGFQAEALADGLNRYLPSPIPYRAPMDWSPIITTAFILLVAAVGAPYVIPLLGNKWVWAIASIGTSLIMISGLMFVRIRGNPYVAVGRDGKAEWVASGFQNQFGMETHVVALLYGLLSLSCLALIAFAPRVSSEGRQRAVVYIWCSTALVLFAILLSFFRIKNPGYPFRLIL